MAELTNDEFADGIKALAALDDPELLGWLNDTYTPEGVAIWLRVYERATPERRAELRRSASTYDGQVAT